MAETVAAEKAKSAGARVKESLLRRKYVIPFLLACVILACNQATGVNSIIGYNATILIQAGLGDKQAHLGYVLFTMVNFLITIGAVVLVDRKGRKFLLSLGSAGIIVSLICVGLLFHKTEKLRVDVQRRRAGDGRDESNAHAGVQSKHRGDQLLADRNLGKRFNAIIAGHHLFLRRFPRGHFRRCVPRMRRPSRLKSHAPIACRPTKSSPFSPIRSPIWMPRALRR